MVILCMMAYAVMRFEVISTSEIKDLFFRMESLDVFNYNGSISTGEWAIARL